MKTVFLGWSPSGQPIQVDFDHTVSRLIDVGQLKAVVPIGTQLGLGWRAGWHPTSQTFYVFRDQWIGKDRKTEYLHRFLNNLEQGDGLDVHHKDGCGLNCSHSNMVVIKHPDHVSLGWQEGRLKDWQTGLLEAHKTRRARSRTSFYGVYLAAHGGFFASATIPGHRPKYLGKFDDPKAAAAYVNYYLSLFNPHDWRMNAGV